MKYMIIFAAKSFPIVVIMWMSKDQVTRLRLPTDEHSDQRRLRPVLGG